MSDERIHKPQTAGNPPGFGTRGVGSGHEYGARDKEFLERGLKDILNFVMMVIRRKEK